MFPDEDDQSWDDIVTMATAIPGAGALAAMTAYGLNKLSERWAPKPGPDDTDSVRLIHASDLQSWSRFPRCQDADTVTYGQYRARMYELKQLRKRVRPLVRARQRIAVMDTDETVRYHTESQPVPRSLLRRQARIALEHQRIPGTWLECAEGQVSMSPSGDAVTVQAGWGKRWVTVVSMGPSRVVHAEELAQLRGELAAATGQERRDAGEVLSSRYRQPVLFVSHRWESADHPDPDGSQLRRLRALRDCWLIYDYTSFPQVPRTPAEEEQFQQILDRMPELISRAVILAAPDYLTRGWLVFEYLVASLAADIVCDEVSGQDFVGLRDWVASRPPMASNPWRDGYESNISNEINGEILAAVDQILPVYRSARFRDEHDSTKVTGLLTAMLKARLAPHKESQEYFGEWAASGWTDEELAQAFRGRISSPAQRSRLMRPFLTSVPATLAEAADRGYRVRTMTLAQQTNPFQLLGWPRRTGLTSRGIPRPGRRSPGA